MKFSIKSFVMNAVVVLAAVAMLFACVTTGMDRSTAAAVSIKQVDDEITALYVQIDLTAVALSDVLASTESTIRKNYDIFARAVPKLEKHGKTVVAREASMVSAHRTYFAEWETQGSTYVNPVIRQLSSDRRAMLEKKYDIVLAGNQDIKQYYYDNMTDLKEINSYLSNNLSLNGLKAIDPTAQTSIQRLYSFKYALNPMIEALSDIKDELYNENTKLAVTPKAQ